jgi:heme-degrading monooxygenase HmoA
MPVRDLDGPVAVINRFTVKGDVGEFERAFRAHSQFLRRQNAFDFLVTVQLLDQPNVYVNLGHWRSLRSFLEVVHDNAFLAQVQRLGSMVHTQADQAVSVSRVLRREALVGAANIVLTHADVFGDHQDFERRFADMSSYCGQLEGFGGSDLLRSTMRPTAYLGLSWWYDTEACERALDSDGYREHRAALVELAEVASERSRHIAYEGVLPG